MRSARELVDEALPEDELEGIRATIRELGAPRGVVGFHKLRARRAGARRYVDVHVQFARRHDARGRPRARRAAGRIRDRLPAPTPAPRRARDRVEPGTHASRACPSRPRPRPRRPAHAPLAQQHDRGERAGRDDDRADQERRAVAVGERLQRRHAGVQLAVGVAVGDRRQDGEAERAAEQPRGVQQPRGDARGARRDALHGDDRRGHEREPEPGRGERARRAARSGSRRPGGRRSAAPGPARRSACRR